jgi:transposase
MYDTILALDWAKSNMAVATWKKEAKAAKVFERKPDLEYLIKYIKSIPGTKSLTIEEAPSAQFLFEALSEHVDDMIICDPRKNELLKEGAKTDKVDAERLAFLTRVGALRRVYHCKSDIMEVKYLVSGYLDVNQAIVRAKNHKSANESYVNDKFVLEMKAKEVAVLEEIKKEYLKKFKNFGEKFPVIKNLSEINGIGLKGAVKILGVVLNPHRFERSKSFMAYCGLALYKRASGNREYKDKNNRYNRVLKSVFKTAALAAIGGENVFADYYRFLIEKKRFMAHNARNAIARLIAKVSLAIMKSGQEFKPEHIKAMNLA